MIEINVSIIIVTYKTKEITCNCVRSILDSEIQYSYEIIVVDNYSCDGTVEELRTRFPEIQVIACTENLGFSKGNNIGIKQAKGDYLLLLNSDTIVLNDSIENLLTTAILKNYDICGPILLNEDQTIQRSWFNFPSPIKTFLRLTDIYIIFYKLSNTYLLRLIYAGKKPAFMISQFNQDTQIDYLSFACILIKKDIINTLGGLDESLTFYHEDCEYGLRARTFGHNITYTISSKIIHLGGTSSSAASFFALENDVKGLLYIFKKYYPGKTFKMLRIALLTAFSWRIILWNFGLYRNMKKIGLYSGANTASNRSVAKEALHKYREIRHYIRNYR